MNYQILGSSSKGNCIIVEDILMLDCGVSYKKIKEYIKQIKVIFISHNHQDHLNKKTIKQIAFNFPKIKFVTGSMFVVQDLVNCGVLPQNVYVLKKERKYSLGLLNVKLEELYHDTPNYALKWQINGKKGIYIVDTFKVEHIQAKNYDLYLIENNYNEELLKNHIQECIDNGNDENKLYYLNRVERVHLSDTQCNDFLIQNMGQDSIYEKIHKSSYNYVDID